MKKINVTYALQIIDLGYDEEIGCNQADEDGRFVINNLPQKHHSAFWKRIKSLPGCSRRLAKECPQGDGRLRVDWNNFCTYEERMQAKEEILKVIQVLVPDAKVRYRELG